MISEASSTRYFATAQQSRKGSLIIGHVCIESDCFMYGSLMISEARSTRYSATAYHMPRTVKVIEHVM